MRHRGTCGGGRAGRGTATVAAIRQTHQCRFSHRSLDPTGQHHDAGAGHATAGPRAGIGGERPIAVTAPDFGDGPDAGGSQEAGGAETPAPLGARPDCAGSAGSRRRKRLMLSKVAADR